MDFQSIALPTELPRHAIVSKVARTTGLEPATFGVTGRRSNQLSYARVLAKRHYDRFKRHRARLLSVYFCLLTIFTDTLLP